jgi:hypothetical protein
MVVDGRGVGKKDYVCIRIVREEKRRGRRREETGSGALKPTLGQILYYGFRVLWKCKAGPPEHDMPQTPLSSPTLPPTKTLQ